MLSLAWARQLGEIELDQLDTASTGPRRFAYAGRRLSCLVQVTRRADDMRAVRSERPRRFDADSRGHTSDQDSLTLEIPSAQHFIRRGCRIEYVAHDPFPC